MNDISAGPYAQAVQAYRDAGWPAVLPLPPGRKSPPPVGFTGWAGVAPSGADYAAWLMGEEAAGNVGLHLRDDVIGIDVDAYAGKDGAAALAELTERAGVPLPPTWVSSARADGVSGIRLYRASPGPGRVWIDQPAGAGRGIEMIHRGHRYAVVWPSVHPAGGTYRWWTPPADSDAWMDAGGAVPSPEMLPELPAAWVAVLSRPGEVAGGTAAGHAETLEAVDGWVAGGAEPCGPVAAALSGALASLARATVEALHPTANGDIWELARLGHEGHRGARRALAEHYSRFLVARGDVRHEGRAVAEAEWWRMVRGAVGKLPPGPAATADPCDAVLFAPGLVPGAVPADPFAPAAGGGPGDGGTAGGGATGEAAVDPADWLIGQMLTAEQLRLRPPPRPLVSGLLDVDSIAWLVAAPKSYKSFVALDLAAAVGAGRSWMGRRVAQGKVVYLVAEGVTGMSLRVRAHEQEHGPMTDVLFLPIPVQVAAPGQWEALVEACRRIKPALVVIDTQARVTVGMKENDNSDMGVFVDAAERLRAASEACVLVIHHTGKQGDGPRGASAITGALSTGFTLRRTADYRAELKTTEQKDMEGDMSFDIVLKQLSWGIDEETGRPLSSLVVLAGDGRARTDGPEPDWKLNLTENQLVIISVVTDHFDGIGATEAGAWSMAKGRKRKDASGRQIDPMARNSFNTAWASLIKKGVLIRVKGTQRYVTRGMVEAGFGEALDVPDKSAILGAL